MLEGFIPSVKRLLLLILVGCSFLLFVNQTFAQAFPPGSPPDPFTPNIPIGGPGTFPIGGNGDGSTGGNSDGGTGGGGAGGGQIDSITAPPPEEPAVEVSSSGCWDSPEGFLNCIVVSFFGSIAAIAGYTFDASIRLFIVGFGELYLQDGIGSTVERVWTTVRDVFNLTFIFGLVYIGFQIILGTNESSAKRTLPLLILAALLVNFSLFVVKFIVDFANLAAIQIFNLFTAGASPTAQVGDQGIPANGIVDVLANAQGDSLSLAFINTIGVSGLLNNSIALDGAGGGIMYMFTMVIIFCVLTYVFFAGAILITIRFAALVFYMIFSPVMFLGWVFPGFKSYTDKFWKGLFGQAFFAPMLLFMLYVTYQLARGFDDGSRTGGEGISANPENITAFAQFMPYLVMIVIFIVASYVVARKMADTGGSMVMKANDWALGKAKVLTGAATAGVAARVGRNTLGAGAYAIQNNDTFKDIAARNGRFGKMMYAGVGKVADSSYDARKVGGLGKKLGVGEGRKGGFATILKEEKEADEKFLKTLGTTGYDDSKRGGAQSTAITNLKAAIAAGVSDPAQELHMKTQLSQLQEEYNEGKKDWGPEKEYARQLEYISKMEKWKNTQKVYTGSAILAAAAVATGGLGLAAGAATAAVGTGVSTGYWYNSKKAAGALRKDYGKDGGKKKKADQDKKAKEAAAAALGLEKKDDGHDKKAPGESAKKDSGGHAPAAAPVKAASSAPKAAASHDHH